jgi:hypothetical protein
MLELFAITVRLELSLFRNLWLPFGERIGPQPRSAVPGSSHDD